MTVRWHRSHMDRSSGSDNTSHPGERPEKMLFREQPEGAERVGPEPPPRPFGVAPPWLAGAGVWAPADLRGRETAGGRPDGVGALAPVSPVFPFSSCSCCI